MKILSFHKNTPGSWNIIFLKKITPILSNAPRFAKEVEDGIIMMLWNDLHQLSIVNCGIIKVV